jgi:very-short-patch-repair endonuclease
VGVKFRRQHPIGPFFVDFCCVERRLVIELDGGQHATQRDADARRTTFLADEGYHVIRFWDNEALTNLNGVLESILLHLQSPSPQPSPRRGEGGRGGEGRVRG